MHKRTILLDIDGTLIDSNDAHVDAWQKALAAHGHQFSRREIHAQIGQGGDNLVPSLLPDAGAEEIERLGQAEGEIYKRESLPGIMPFKGARETLRRLHERGHRLVLASSASRAEVDHYIGLLDAEDLLAGTTSRDDVGASKPCPDIFVAALELSGDTADKAVVIGDTPYDIISAHRAGIEAIALLSGGFEYDDLAQLAPIAIYRSISDLDTEYETSPLGRD
jgi:HAD superfamily hydrolase (TIGR01509 family)